MSPCGMVTDLLRSHHAILGLMIDGSGQEFWVRFYPTAPGAKPLPIWSAFGSPVWEDVDGPPDLAFRKRPLEWRPKKYPAPPGDHFHGDPSWFVNGLPPAEYVSPTNPQRCQGGNLDDEGGVEIGGEALMGAAATLLIGGVSGPVGGLVAGGVSGPVGGLVAGGDLQPVIRGLLIGGASGAAGGSQLGGQAGSVGGLVAGGVSGPGGSPDGVVVGGVSGAAGSVEVGGVSGAAGGVEVGGETEDIMPFRGWRLTLFDEELSMSDSTDYTLTWDDSGSSDIDTDDFFDPDDDPSLVFVRISGVYLVGVNPVWHSHNTGERIVTIQAAGSLSAKDVQPGIGGVGTSTTCAQVMALEEGSTLEVHAFQSSGTTLTLGVAGYEGTVKFWGIYLGPLPP